MKHMLMIAGAAALGFAGPALAKPGNGHGNPHDYGNARPRATASAAARRAWPRRKRLHAAGPGQEAVRRGQRCPRGYGNPLQLQPDPVRPAAGNTASIRTTAIITATAISTASIRARRLIGAVIAALLR